MFRCYANKRLASVTSTIMTSSKMECALLCMMTNTCSVANVTMVNDVIVCNLAAGSNHVNNAQDDTGSDVLVLGEHLSTCSALIGHCVLLSHSCGKLGIIADSSMSFP